MTTRKGLMGLMSTQAETDSRLMLRAIDLSKKGFTAPNPHVGCVIALNDEIVGEGYHHHAGGDHAELEALRMAGSRAKGSTAYVTLEPCNHHGRTPPCSVALISAGVRRVVVACADPNPKASGGMARLADAGIVTEISLHADRAADANIMFLTAMKHKRPFIVVKAAASLDGRIALPTGESKWITGTPARKQANRLRADCGAVLVGRKTVEADDPHLTARVGGVVNQPLRLVLDPTSRLNSHWNIFDSSAPSLHLVEGALGLRARNGRFDLNEICAALFEVGLTSLLVEGGGYTVTSFIKAGLADRIELFLAPLIIGNGLSWIQGLELGFLSEAPRYRVVRVKNLSGDLQITLVR